MSRRNMLGDVASTRLTKELLEEQERLFNEQDQRIGGSWAERVVHDERVHLFHSQLGIDGLHNRIQMDLDNSSRKVVSEDHAFTPGEREEESHDGLTWFKPRQDPCQESPLERFLTPDGCSDPSFFARRALAEMGTPLGSTKTIEERQIIAKANVEKVKRMARENGDSLG